MALCSAIGASVAADTREVPFGALALRWNPEIWSLVETPGGLQASCLVAACKGRLVVGSVTPGAMCDPPEPERRQGAGETTLVSGPLQWRVATWWLGCRNAHPQSIDACAVHDGRVYRLSAPVLTCRTSPGRGSDAAILDLVRGAGP